MLKSLLLFLISLCLVGQIYGFGSVVPETIYAFENEVNQTIECTFNLSLDDDLKKYSNKDALFNETCDNNSWVIYDINNENVERLAKDRIRLRLPNLNYSECKYTCWLGRYSVAFAKVFVGKRLDKVKDFKCRSQNWQNMTCSFTEMDNHIPLSYKMTYDVYSFKPNAAKTCSLYNDTNRGKYCKLYQQGSATSSSHPEFYKADDDFYVTLESQFNNRTKLNGTLMEYFKVDHLASVVPLAPTELETKNTTTDGVTLQYRIPSHYIKTRITFDFEIDTKSKYSETWQFTTKTNIGAENTELRIPLQYPFTEYDIRLRMKSHNADNIEEMWSSYVNTRVKTLSRVPDRPPTSTFGAFYIHDDGNLTLYWQQLQKYEENGANFSYKIVETKPKELKSISADFSHLPLAQKAHNFAVFSSNANGTSREPLTIHVPQKSDLLNVHISLVQKSEQEKHNLTWTCGGNETHLIDKFVIFSCVSTSGNPNTCEGDLNFVTVEREKRWTIFNANPMLLYAIAAYAGSRTTGMKWSECRSHAPDHIGKLLYANIDRNRRIDPYSLTIMWGVDCPDKEVIKHFNISVCRSEVCDTMYPDKDARSQVIQNLSPFTNYKILVRMISTSDKLGTPYEVLEKTAETAPSAPTKLLFTNLTSNSVQLLWTKPENENGQIRHHRIEFFSYERDMSRNDSQEEPHKHERNAEVNTTEYVLDGLKSFTKYEVYLFACTTECSKDATNIISFKTEIGAPETPSISHTPSVSEKIVSWEPPSHFGGNLTFYEVRIKPKMDSNEIIYRVKDKSCRLENLCQMQQNDYEISVRAVNIINSDLYWSSKTEELTKPCSEIDEDLKWLSDDQLIPGNWTTTPYSCYTQFFSWSNVGGSLFVLAMLCFGAFFIFKEIKKCDINIEMPEAVKDISVTQEKNQYGFSRLPNYFSRKRPTQPDIVLVHGGSEIREKVQRSDQSEPLLPPSSFRDGLNPIFEMPEREVEAIRTVTTPYLPMSVKPDADSFELLSSTSINQTSPSNSVETHLDPTPYVEMRPPQMQQDLPSNGYVPIQKGFTQTNYVGSVVQPNARTSLKDEMLKISQMQQKNTAMSGYVQPGFVGR